MKKLSTIIFVLGLFFSQNIWAADLALLGVGLDTYLVPGEHEVVVYVENTGSSTITSFELSWSINGETNSYVFEEVDFDDNDDIHAITLPNLIIVDAGTTVSELSINVEEVNEGTDSDDNNDEINHTIRRLSADIEKNILLEKITATWCPNCPEGDARVAEIQEMFPGRFLDVHWHRSDEFSISEFDDLDDIYGGGQPRAMFDRHVFPEFVVSSAASSTPGFYRKNYFTTVAAYRTSSNAPVHLATEVDYSSSSRNLTVDIDATFYAEMEAGAEYRLNCYLIENDILADQDNHDDDINNGDDIDDYEQKTIVRAALGGIWGSENSLPSSLEEGETYSHQFTYEVPEEFDDDNLHVIILVQRYNEDNDFYENEILNALQGEFDSTDELAIEVIETNNCNISVDVPTISSDVAFLCDGDVATLTTNESAPSGFEYQWQLSGNDLEDENGEELETTTPGSYTVYLTDGDGCTSQNAATIFIPLQTLPGYNVEIDTDDNTIAVSTNFTSNPQGVDIEWSLGDGNYVTGYDFEYTYEQAGTYSLCPTISNDCATIGECYLVVIEHPYQLDAKVLLEGPYDNDGEMHADLQNIIPLNQPYNVEPYNYEGLEQLPEISSDMVDWILVEARTGTPGTTEMNTEIVETTVALLLADGSIKDLNGVSGVGFNNLEDGEDYYFVIRHRNHLDIISANSVEADNNMSYDFTLASAQASGSNQLKASDDGFFYMFTGDFSQDGVIQVSDYDVWKAAPAILDNYEITDANLDRVVQLTDFDFWLPNKAKIGNIEIRY